MTQYERSRLDALSKCVASGLQGRMIWNDTVLYILKLRTFHAKTVAPSFHGW
ncbi:hypothetical protein CcCBS67573_g05531 [Chytriomyces confervae]|uniref:Uncharacterized protein n=1 Tax=Chytriomyces confervae TaxID=246404 RepID=A0A507FD43_9FUNG|nr:hypothetical protein CcCBS67573_g05531 [Chytriomyces confervae]